MKTVKISKAAHRAIAEAAVLPFRLDGPAAGGRRLAH